MHEFHGLSHRRVRVLIHDITGERSIMAPHSPKDPSHSPPRMNPDSTRVTEQRALTTSNGNNWLTIGAGLTVICGGLLFGMQWLEPAAVATAGFVIVVALYAVMVVTRFAVPPGRLRLWLLAALMILLVITFFVCAGIIAATEWNTPALH